MVYYFIINDFFYLINILSLHLHIFLFYSILLLIMFNNIFEILYIYIL